MRRAIKSKSSAHECIWRKELGFVRGWWWTTNCGKEYRVETKAKPDPECPECKRPVRVVK